MRAVYKLMVLLVLVPVLASGAEKYKYFLHAGVDPVSQAFTGRHETSEENCKKAICYRFAYNEQNKLARIEHVLDGKYVFYDEMPSAKVDSGDGWQKLSVLKRTGKLSITENREELPVLENAATLSKSKNFEVNNIGQLLFQLDSKGRVVSRSYLDHWGKLAGDQHKYARFVFTLDDQGRIVKEKIYNIYSGKVSRNESRFEYDQSKGGLVVKETIYLPDSTGDKPVDDENGVMIYKRTYDENHNLVNVEYYGDDGQLKHNRATGTAIEKYKYDDSGNLIEASYFGVDRKPEDQKEESASVVKYKYDGQGNLIEKDYCDGGGKLKKGRGGVAVDKWNINSTDQTVELSFLDDKGKLTPNSKAPNQAAKIWMQMDQNLNLTEAKFFEKNGKMGDSYAPIYKFKYDDQNNLTDVNFYNKLDKITDTKKEGFASTQFKYDNLGGLVEVTFYDKLGKLKDRKDMKIAGMQMQRDIQGYIIDIKYFDKNRKEKTFRSDIYKPSAEIEFMNDSRSLLIKGTYRDKFGEESLGQLLF